MAKLYSQKATSPARFEESKPWTNVQGRAAKKRMAHRLAAVAREKRIPGNQ